MTALTLWLVVVTIGACKSSSEATTSKRTPAPQPVVEPIPVPRECAGFTEVIVPDEVARWCAHPTLDVVGDSGECVFRLKGGGEGGVRLRTLPATAENRQALQGALAPTLGTPALLLGAGALAFYDRVRKQTAFVLEAAGQVVRIVAPSAACEPGPLSRLATIVRSRLSPPLK